MNNIINYLHDVLLLLSLVVRPVSTPPRCFSVGIPPANNPPRAGTPPPLEVLVVFMVFEVLDATGADGLL
jgi:hypothetical protein